MTDLAGGVCWLQAAEIGLVVAFFDPVGLPPPGAVLEAPPAISAEAWAAAATRQQRELLERTRGT